MEMPYHQMGHGDRARVAVMIASDPTSRPTKCAVQLRLLEESLEIMRLASSKWSKEKLGYRSQNVEQPGTLLETMPPRSSNE